MAIQRSYDLIPRGGVALDSTEDIIFTWKVSGGTQVSYSITIYNNTNNTIVFQELNIANYTSRYTLLANTLANGNEYKWQVTTYDTQGNNSTSFFEIFQTSSKPVVIFNTFPSVLNSPSYSFSATYSQNQSVGLKNWSIFLYNSSSTLIQNSGIQTSQTIEYLFTNLKNDTDYFVEIQVTSNKNLIGTTGKIPFSAYYATPQFFSVLIAENNDEKAGINLKWNVSQIIGEYTCGIPVFIDNEKIDLRDGCKIIYDEGFDINNIFTLKLWIEDPNHRQNLMYLKGDSGEYRLQYNKIDYKFYLYKKNYLTDIESVFVSSQVSGTEFFVYFQQNSLGFINVESEVIS